MKVLARSPTAVLAAAPGLERSLGLRTAVAAYSVVEHPVPRPRGLLGDEHLRRLAAQLGAAMGLHPAGTFRSFRLSAAGAGSPVFRRLAAELASRTGLVFEPAAGELLLRVRPTAAGWETLARLTPRPLSARAWRVADVPGALNATIAAAMVRLTEPGPGDRFLNLMSGSATLLAERLLGGPAVLAAGLELDPAALSASRRNLAAAGVACGLVRGDVRRPPFRPGSFDVICADLPYGERSGSHAANDELYPDFLAAAAALGRPGARLLVISHDIRRFERALAASGRWREESRLRVFQKGYRPAVWRCRRLPDN